MRVFLAVYDAATGAISRKVSCPDTVMELQAGAVEAVMLVERGTEFSDSTHFIDLTGGVPVLAERPPAPDAALSAESVLADGEAEIVLAGVPAGALVTIGTTSVVANGDDIAITTDLPGLNRITVDAFPAQIWTGVFHGTAA